MDIKPWDKVRINVDDNGWKGIETICKDVQCGVAFLFSPLFPHTYYEVTDQNRDRVEILPE